MKTVTNLSQEEYRSGAELAFDNCDDLLSIAKRSFEVKIYGTSAALSILAFEEITKAIVFELKGLNKEVPIKKLGKFFSSHKVKHDMGLAVFSSLVKEINGENEELGRPIEDLDNSTIVFLLFLVATAALNLITTKEDSDDKKKRNSYFDELKSAGFYVDYNIEKLRWQYPSQIFDKDKAKLIYELVNHYSFISREWIINNSGNPEIIFEFLSSLDDDVIDKEQLNDLIKKIKDDQQKTS